MTPFFSIGVTTYDRLDMLIECVQSIQAQTFKDFECIIGNDNPDRALTLEMLAIEEDERFIINNRPINLGEIANMNALLAQAKGRYFTWLADDDLYNLSFLEKVHYLIISMCSMPGFMPAGVFTTYGQDDRGDYFYHSINRFYQGKEFLTLYLLKKLKIIGCYGVYGREYLLSIGGMEKLTVGISPYSDNLLAIKQYKQEWIGHVDLPLIHYRIHDKSLSATSGDIKDYLEAQWTLFKRHHKLLSWYEKWLLLKWFLKDDFDVIRR